MNSKAYRWLLSYGVAIASTAIALLISLWLQPLLDRTIGSFFYVAVMVSTWYGGTRPGAASIVLSLLALNYYFMPPLGKFEILEPEDVVRVGIVAMVATMITLLSGNLQESKRKVETLNRRLQKESNEQLKTALNAAQMGMWNWNMVTGKITWSPEHELLLGFPLGSFDGKYETFDACLYSDDREGLNQAIALSLQNRTPYHHEFRVVWADGSIHWIEGRGNAFYNTDGQPVQMSGTIMAIDKRKQTEAELHDRERLFSTLAETLPVVIFRFDQNSYCNYINNYWTALTGRTIESVAGLGWVETLHPEERDRLASEWLEWCQNAEQRGLYQNEGRLVHANGKDIWYYIQALPEVNSNGETIGYLGVFTDITQQKQSETVLQQFNVELEQRVAERTEELNTLNNRLLSVLKEQHQAKRDVEDLYNNAPCGYHSLNAEGTIVGINDTELKWMGFTRDEVLNKMKFTDFITPESQQAFRQSFPQFIQRGWANDLEFQLCHKNGSTRWVNVNGIAIKDDTGNFVMSRSSLFDISDRKQAEQALALQAVITRNMAEGICLVKADDASIVYVNPKFEQMFGYDPGELNGQHVAILNYPSESVTAENVYQSIRAAAFENREFTYDVHNIKKDGTPFWCSATCSIFQHPEYGNVLVAVQQDITERRKIDQMKQDFISIVSHELRTPLTSIRGSLGLIVGGVYDKKPEKMKEMIAIAARQSDRLVRLVNDILNLRRLESGQAKFKFQQCSAADLIQQSVDVMRSQAEQNQVTLDIIPTTAKVWADVDAIVQTLTNLLSNAIKFSSPNSTVTITAISHLPTSLSPHFSTLFSVQDQGRGIPSDQLETIFGQFQQVDVSDSRDKGGTGLGLAICQTIIKQHGGRIWVESILEQGSTFYFILPSTQLLPDNG